eukprot:TRINITY_DN9338_c0_g1_i1.p1 TRINITY_DN9338_c0_g1~~TRINITY_DN9338_c0_g1_i1.p1  ORF type:complete len:328 (+),score=73.90 TRINITY_DN9338_c0_g1_i1:60-1043(+)
MAKKKFVLPKRSLSDACTIGDIKLVKKMIASGEHDNEAINRVLHAACTYGQLEVVQLLLENGADVNGRIEGGHTPLICAAFNGRSEILNTLLQHGADPSLFNDELETAADLAKNKQHNKIVADLRFAHLKSHRVNTNPTEAITSGSLFDLKLLQDMEQWMPSQQDFILAVASYIQLVSEKSSSQHNSLSIIKWMLRTDKSLVNSTSEETTETPLIMAAGSGDMQLVEILLEAGADITTAATDPSNAKKQITARERARISKSTFIESLLALREAELQYKDYMKTKSTVDIDDRQEWVEKLRMVKGEVNKRKTEYESISTEHKNSSEAA